MTDIAVATPPPAPPISAQKEQLNLLWKLADMTQKTEMVPKGLRGRPDAILAVMVYGHELGLKPMSALREVFIVDGTPSCSAGLMRSQILRAGHKLVWRKISSSEIVLYGERCDGRGEGEVTWTLEDAKIAGLLAKDNWKRYPRAMLAARATSELARLVFPDVTIGYTPEELGRVDLSGDYDYIDVGADIPPEETGGRAAAELDAAELVEAFEAGVDPETGEIIEPRHTPGAS